MNLQTVKTQAKYGLINKKEVVSSKTVSNIKPKVLNKNSSIFLSEDDLLEQDDEEEDNKNSKSSTSFSRKEISKVNHLIKPSIAPSNINENNLESSIYDYDGEYDNFKQQQEQERQTKITQLSSQPTAVCLQLQIVYNHNKVLSE